MERQREHPAPRCPLCREALEAEALPLRDCPGCATSYHQLCLDELGGCSTLGCAELGARGDAGSSLPRARLEEIRQRVADENKRWAQLVELPRTVTVASSAEALRIVIDHRLDEDRRFGFLVTLAVWLGATALAVSSWLFEDPPTPLPVVLAISLPLFAACAYMLRGWRSRDVLEVTPEQLTVSASPRGWAAPLRVPVGDIADVVIERRSSRQGRYDEHLVQRSRVGLKLTSGREVPLLGWREEPALMRFVHGHLRRRLGLDGKA